MEVKRKLETSECQLAYPEKTCPTKILEQLTTPSELFALLIGNASNHTFKVQLTTKDTNEPFERQVTVNCYGFSIELDDSGKPKIETIKGVSMRVFKTNQSESQFARQTIQQKSALKAGNTLLFGGKSVLSSDDSLNFVVKEELATEDELVQAKPFLNYLKSQPKS